jgi:signal transduction histidine kinase
MTVPPDEHRDIADTTLVRRPVAEQEGVTGEGTQLDEWLENRNYQFDPGQSALFIMETAESVSDVDLYSASNEEYLDRFDTIIRRSHRLLRIIDVQTSPQTLDYRLPMSQGDGEDTKYPVMTDTVFLKGNSLAYATESFRNQLQAFEDIRKPLQETAKAWGHTPEQQRAGMLQILESLGADEKFRVDLAAQNLRSAASQVAESIFILPPEINKEVYLDQLAESILCLDPETQRIAIMRHAARYGLIITKNFQGKGDTAELIANKDAYGLFRHEMMKAPTLIQTALLFIRRLPDQTERRIHEIIANIHQSRSIIQLGLRFFERMLEEHLHDNSPTELRVAITSAVEDFRESHGLLDHEFPIQVISDQDHVMQIHPQALHRSIVEVLTNAEKYALTEKGVVIIIDQYETQYGQKRKATRIRIRDFGPGCPNTSTMWDLGVRHSNHVPGTGLGLFMVKTIMKGAHVEYFANNVTDNLGTGLEITLMKYE